MLLVLSLLSMILGNVVAIAQTNIKRMLAYSTIANMGFMLMGFLAANNDGYSAAMFYMVTYVLTTLVGFGIVLLLSRAGFEADQLDDFKGLNQRSPWYAFMMLLAMFSLAGVPPTVGFYAKFSVIWAAVDIGLVWLAVIAVLTSLIGAFYYLRIVKLMYFDDAVDKRPIEARGDTRLLLSVNGLALLLLGDVSAEADGPVRPGADPFVLTCLALMRVGLFVTCLVDLMRPSVGLAALRAARGRRGRGLRSADANLLRTAWLQRRRSRRGEGAGGEGGRRIRGLRASGRPVGVVQWHDQDPLRGPVP